jgi:CheY-like chemotaxis protein
VSLAARAIRRYDRHRVRTVAVVEDNPDNRLLLQALLEDRYRVVEFETGADALAGFGAETPDLVLLDVSLPGIDGTEVLARIRAAPALRTLPVIALTAHAMQGDREKLLAAGFDGYVAKPITDERVLLDAIEGLLASG